MEDSETLLKQAELEEGWIKYPELYTYNAKLQERYFERPKHENFGKEVVLTKDKHPPVPRISKMKQEPLYLTP
jgi:hypothetical protein